MGWSPLFLGASPTDSSTWGEPRGLLPGIARFRDGIGHAGSIRPTPRRSRDGAIRRGNASTPAHSGFAGQAAAVVPLLIRSAISWAWLHWAAVRRGLARRLSIRRTAASTVVAPRTGSCRQPELVS